MPPTPVRQPAQQPPAARPSGSMLRRDTPQARQPGRRGFSMAPQRSAQATNSEPAAYASEAGRLRGEGLDPGAAMVPNLWPLEGCGSGRITFQHVIYWTGVEHLDKIAPPGPEHRTAALVRPRSAASPGSCGGPSDGEATAGGMRRTQESTTGKTFSG